MAQAANLPSTAQSKGHIVGCTWHRACVVPPKEARDDLSNERVQHARLLVQDLCSEADIQVAEMPLATYRAAIKTVAPLIDAGRIGEAKAAPASPAAVFLTDSVTR